MSVVHPKYLKFPGGSYITEDSAGRIGFFSNKDLEFMAFDPTPNAAYPRGRLGLIDSTGTFRDFLHLDNTDAAIFAADFAAISKNIFFETALVILMASAYMQIVNTTPASEPTFQMDCVTNLFRVLYSQQGSPLQTQHQVLELFAAGDPQYFHLRNNAGTERIGIRTGTGGNRGVIKAWDATAAAFKYAYIDNGAWVIANSEPT